VRLARPLTRSCRRVADSVLFPRYIALLLLRNSRPFFSETELGQLIGMEGQGTTRHALGKARDMLENEPDFRAAYDHARESLENQQPQPN